MFIIVYWHEERLVGDDPLYLKFEQNWLRWSKKKRFQSIYWKPKRTSGAPMLFVLPKFDVVWSTHLWELGAPFWPSERRTEKICWITDNSATHFSICWHMVRWYILSPRRWGEWLKSTSNQIEYGEKNCQIVIVVTVRLQ